MADRRHADEIPEDTAPYQGHFTESRFRNKIRQAARLGRRPLALSLTLYYTFRDPRTPAWCKTVILGALGYFISILDALPDLTPVLGYTDDVGVMVAALAVLGSHVLPQHRDKAARKAAALLGDEDQAEESARHSPEK